jgi:hypothetical protein
MFIFLAAAFVVQDPDTIPLMDMPKLVLKLILLRLTSTSRAAGLQDGFSTQLAGIVGF